MTCPDANPNDYHDDDLIRRGDVLDSIHALIEWGRTQQHGDEATLFYDGHEEALMMIADCLTGWCATSHAIKARGRA